MKTIKIILALIVSIGLSYFAFADRTVTQNQVKQVVPVVITNIVDDITVVTTNGFRNPLGIINESVTYFSSATSNTIASVAAAQVTNNVAAWAMSGMPEPQGGVVSVNGKTGVVELVASDIGALPTEGGTMSGSIGFESDRYGLYWPFSWGTVIVSASTDGRYGPYKVNFTRKMKPTGTVTSSLDIDGGDIITSQMTNDFAIGILTQSFWYTADASNNLDAVKQDKLFVDNDWAVSTTVDKYPSFDDEDYSRLVTSRGVLETCESLYISVTNYAKEVAGLPEVNPNREDATFSWLNGNSIGYYDDFVDLGLALGVDSLGGYLSTVDHEGVSSDKVHVADILSKSSGMTDAPTLSSEILSQSGRDCGAKIAALSNNVTHTLTINTNSVPYQTYDGTKDITIDIASTGGTSALPDMPWTVYKTVDGERLEYKVDINDDGSNAVLVVNRVIPMPNYLCFTAEEPNSTISMDASPQAPSVNLEYSYDGFTEWTQFIVGSTVITLADIGDKVYFRAGEGGNVAMSSVDGYANIFSIRQKVSVSGNIMFLLDKKGNAELSPACFISLFMGTNITTAPEMPATNLTENCYAYMYTSCSNLKICPYLPAKKLTNFCYYNMFAYAISLQELSVGFDTWDSQATYTWLVNAGGESPVFKCSQTLIDNTTTRSVNTVPQNWTMIPQNQ